MKTSAQPSASIRMIQATAVTVCHNRLDQRLLPAPGPDEGLNLQSRSPQQILPCLQISLSCIHQMSHTQIILSLHALYASRYGSRRKENCVYHENARTRPHDSNCVSQNLDSVVIRPVVHDSSHKVQTSSFHRLLVEEVVHTELQPTCNRRRQIYGGLLAHLDHVGHILNHER